LRTAAKSQQGEKLMELVTDSAEVAASEEVAAAEEEQS
jgi:hypothetical protein